MFQCVDRSEAPDVMAGLMLGFVADPFMRWLLPDAKSFLAEFPRIMEFFGGRAFEHSGAYADSAGAGAALWLPPGVHPDEEGLIACFQEVVAPEKHDALFATFEQMDLFHPTEPCWHLAFIAVDPARQGKGMGSALLRHSLEACDASGAIAYLESTNPANLSLYRRAGFEEMGVIEAPGAPPLYPMLRPAQ